MKNHVVRPGDTTTSIAALHGLAVEQLLAVNTQKPRVVALVSGRPTQVFATLTPGEQLAVSVGAVRSGCNCGG